MKDAPQKQKEQQRRQHAPFFRPAQSRLPPPPDIVSSNAHAPDIPCSYHDHDDDVASPLPPPPRDPRGLVGVAERLRVFLLASSFSPSQRKYYYPYVYVFPHGFVDEDRAPGVPPPGFWPCHEGSGCPFSSRPVEDAGEKEREEVEVEVVVVERPRGDDMVSRSGDFFNKNLDYESSTSSSSSSQRDRKGDFFNKNLDYESSGSGGASNNHRGRPGDFFNENLDYESSSSGSSGSRNDLSDDVYSDMATLFGNTTVATVTTTTAGTDPPILEALPNLAYWAMAQWQREVLSDRCCSGLDASHAVWNQAVKEGRFCFVDNEEGRVVEHDVVVAEEEGNNGDGVREREDDKDECLKQWRLDFKAWADGNGDDDDDGQVMGIDDGDNGDTWHLRPRVYMMFDKDRHGRYPYVWCEASASSSSAAARVLPSPHAPLAPPHVAQRTIKEWRVKMRRYPELDAVEAANSMWISAAQSSSEIDVLLDLYLEDEQGKREQDEASNELSRLCDEADAALREAKSNMEMYESLVAALTRRHGQTQVDDDDEVEAQMKKLGLFWSRFLDENAHRRSEIQEKLSSRAALVNLVDNRAPATVQAMQDMERKAQNARQGGALWQMEHDYAKGGFVRALVRVRPPLMISGTKNSSGTTFADCFEIQTGAQPAPRYRDMIVVKRQRRQGSATDAFLVDGVISPGASEDEALDCINPIIRSAFDGGAATALIGYGRSGSGKTHTAKGVVGRVADTLFSRKEGVEVFVRCVEVGRRRLGNPSSGSAMAKGGDEMVDLLSDIVGECETRPRTPPPQKTPWGGLGSRLDKVKCTRVATGSGLRQAWDHVSRARNTAGTKLNASSSRGHVVMVVSSLGGGGGSMAIVDLAGQERAHQSGATVADSAGINAALEGLRAGLAGLAGGSLETLHWRRTLLAEVVGEALGLSSSGGVPKVMPKVTLLATVAFDSDIDVTGARETLRVAQDVVQARIKAEQQQPKGRGGMKKGEK